MVYRLVLDAHFQYATVQEALGADTWLTTWKNMHYANVRPAGTTQAATAVIPPTPPVVEGDPPANGMITIVVHLEDVDQPSCEALSQEVTTALGAIIAEGGVFNCIGDSGGGVTPE